MKSRSTAAMAICSFMAPDADALFAAIEPILRKSAVTRGADATLRYGGPARRMSGKRSSRSIRPRIEMYSVKEIFYTLQGEGAQSGRAAVFLRFAGCNLWSGPRAGPRSRRLPFLRYGFRRHGRAGRRQVRDAAALADAVARAMAGPGAGRRRQALCRLHRRRAAAAARCAADRCAARARLRDRHRDQRHARRAPPASTGSASARRAARRWSSARATN